MAESLDPVEIDITMRQNVSDEAAKASEGITAMDKATREATQRMQQQLANQEALIGKMRDTIAGLEKQYRDVKAVLDSLNTDKLNPSPGGETAARMLDEVNAALAIQRARLEEIEGAQARATQSVTAATTGRKAALDSEAQSWDNIITTAAGYASAIELQRNFLKNANAELEATKAKVNELKGVISSIQSEGPYKSQKQNEYNELVAKARELARTIKDEEAGLVKLQKGYDALRSSQAKQAQSAGHESQKQITMLTQMRKIREEMAQLRGTDGTVSPENLARYDELKKKLQEIGTSYNIVRSEQKLLTTAGSAGLAGLIQGISGLAGAFSATQGVMSLFVKNNEELAAVQTKLQAAMGIVIGLQQVQTTLHATSAFRLNVVTKATNMLGTANTWLAAKLGISTAAAQVLMATLTLGLSVAITAIIALLSKYSSEADKAAADTRKLNESAAAGAAKQRVEFERLRQQWVAAGNDLKKKEKLVRENTKAYNEFGAKIRDVKDADDMFIKNADKFIESINARAMAAAAMDLAADKYKEAMQKMLDADAREKNTSFWDWVPGSQKAAPALAALSSGNFKALFNPKYYAAAAAKDMRTEAQKAANEMPELVTAALGINETGRKLIADAGAEATDEIKEGSKKYWQDIRDAEQKNMDDAMPGSGDFKKAKAARDMAAKNLKAWDATSIPTTKATESAAEKARKAAQKVLDAQIKLYNDREKADLEAYNSRLESEQKLLDLEDDSFNKRQKQLDINLDKEMLNLNKRTQELIEKQQAEERKTWEADGAKGIFSPATKTTDDLFKISPEAQTEITNSLNVILATYHKGLSTLKADRDKFAHEERLRFASELAQELDGIKTHYEQRRKEAAGNAELLKLLADNEDKETTSAKARHYQKMLQFETEYSQKQMELSGKRYFFEADRQKDLLKIQIEGQKKLIENLETQVNNDPNNVELANQLKAAKQQLALFNKELSKTKTEKFKQLVNDIREIGEALKDTLSDFGLEFSDSANKAIDGFSQTLDGLASIDVNRPVSVITGGLKAIGGLAKAVSGIFGNGTKEQKDTEQLQAITNKVEQTQRSINKLLEKRIDLIKESTAAEAGYLEQLSQEQIKQQQSYVEGMFDRLMNNEIYGKGGKNNNLTLKKLMEMFGLNTFEEFVEWWNNGGNMQMIAAGYDIRNESEWQSLVDTWERLKEAAGEADAAMKEALTGMTFDELKDSLDDLVTQADLAFGDISESFEDNMSQAVLRMVKSSYLTEALKGWYEKFAEAMDDGSLTDAERIALQEYYEQIARTANDMYNQAMDLAGLDNAGTRTGTQGIVASLNQDSVNEVNGSLYALRQTVNNILNINSEALAVLQALSSQLDRIADNTDYLRYLEQIKNDINDLRTRGVTIRN